MKKRTAALFLSLLTLFCLVLGGCSLTPDTVATVTGVTLDDLPDFSDSPYVILDDNQPDFPEEDLTETSFESYSPLDSLGRCGVAYANVGTDLMPTEERGDIGSVKPSGWQTVKYDIVDGKYLYNRCHLIGFQLTGENANEQNLITGTRYMNVDGMLPFENLVADYVKETGNHVLYRVTPVYMGDELVARGVQMEGYSVEDQGEGVCFNVFVYNAQPGITIDYATGDSWLTEDAPAESAPAETSAPVETAVSEEGEVKDYVLNTSSMKFHLPDCSGVAGMSDKNRQDYTGTREALIEEGYAPCGICKP